MLEELERLERAAPTGRHTTGEATRDSIPYVGIGYTDEVYALDSADPHEPVATFARPEDAALYAAARNALPGLLQLWRAVREEHAAALAMDKAITDEEYQSAVVDFARTTAATQTALAALEETA